MLTHAAVAGADAGHKVDGVVPTLASAAVHGKSVLLTYSEALDTDSVPAKGDFTVQGGGQCGDAGEQRPACAGERVGGDADAGDPGGDLGAGGPAVSYTAGTNPVRDAAGNQAANLSNQAVTHAPTVSSVALTSNARPTDSTYKRSGTTVQRDGDVLGGGGRGRPPAARRSWSWTSGARPGRRPTPAGPARPQLVFAYAVAAADADADGIAVGASKLALNGGTIKVKERGRGRAADARGGAGAVAGHKVDGVVPTLSSGATVHGKSVVLTYSEALDTDSVPATRDFSVEGGGQCFEPGEQRPACAGERLGGDADAGDPGSDLGAGGPAVSYTAGRQPGPRRGRQRRREPQQSRRRRTRRRSARWR